MAEINYMDSLFNTNGDFKPKRKENFFTDSYFSVPSPTTKADLQRSSFLSTPTAPPPTTAANSVGRAVAAGVSAATGTEGGSSGARLYCAGHRLSCVRRGGHNERKRTTKVSKRNPCP